MKSFLNVQETESGSHTDFQGSKDDGVCLIASAIISVCDATKDNPQQFMKELALAVEFLLKQDRKWENYGIA